MVILEMEDLANDLPELASNHNSPMSASQVTRIAGMSRQHLALTFLNYFTHRI
jgi:hypothetical protein